MRWFDGAAWTAFTQQAIRKAKDGLLGRDRAWFGLLSGVAPLLVIVFGP